MDLYYGIAKMNDEEETYIFRIQENGERCFSDDIEDAILFKTVNEIPTLQEGEYPVEVSDSMSYEPRSRYVFGQLGSYEILLKTKPTISSFWVLKRKVSPSTLTESSEEFAIDCNCNSTTINHLCTVDSPEMANRYDTKEIVEQEKSWIREGFIPAKYSMTLMEIES